MTPEALLGRRVVGNYVIESLLGAGGMGAVYVARHVSLDTKLAIKVLHAELSARPDIVRRFIAEAKAASDIKHPNIIRVIDVGQFDSGEHYIALEHLDGYSLDRAQLPMPLETICAMVCQVAAGLDAAHARGIIHRDLKPGNLFLAPQPGNPVHTKILDFGIAKLLGDTELGGVHTGTNMVMGTPAYMAPEQARGAAGVTPLSDVYALGAIVFELACARRPYPATTVGEIVHQQLTMPRPDPATLRPDVPPAWCEVVRAALAFEPAARPQSAGDFAELLARATPGGLDIAAQLGFPATGHARLPEPSAGTVGLGSAAQPTTLAGSAAEARPRPRAGRRRWAIAAGIVAALGIGGAALASWTLSGSSRPATPPTPEASADSPAGAAIDAAPASVRLRIEVEPAGATVFVDRQHLGTAPIDIERPAGSEVDLWVEAPGYRPAEKTAIAGVNEVEHFELEPEENAGQVATPARPGRKPPAREAGKPAGTDTPSKPTADPWKVERGDDPFSID
jgi:eukaryotic-like serine/threonine-protein kinase